MAKAEEIGMLFVYVSFMVALEYGSNKTTFRSFNEGNVNMEKIKQKC